MLARKPRMLVAIALANRMARVAWALMTRGGVYRAPVAATLRLTAPEASEGVAAATEVTGKRSRRGGRGNHVTGERLERA
jgi:hypothetical protein